jgi:hypothetical protein
MNNPRVPKADNRCPTDTIRGSLRAWLHLVVAGSPMVQAGNPLSRARSMTLVAGNYSRRARATSVLGDIARGNLPT